MFVIKLRGICAVRARITAFSASKSYVSRRMADVVAATFSTRSIASGTFLLVVFDKHAVPRGRSSHRTLPRVNNALPQLNDAARQYGL